MLLQSLCVLFKKLIFALSCAGLLHIAFSPFSRLPSKPIFLQALNPLARTGPSALRREEEAGSGSLLRREGGEVLMACGSVKPSCGAASCVVLGCAHRSCSEEGPRGPGPDRNSC